MRLEGDTVAVSCNIKLPDVSLGKWLWGFRAEVTTENATFLW